MTGETVEELRAWGCSWPGCTEHPATGGGPIIRVSPKGQPFEGLCETHLAEDAADQPMSAETIAWVRRQRGADRTPTPTDAHGKQT